jgi:hypothetical protein
MRDQTLWVLAAGILLFTFVVILTARFFPNNQGMYALFAGILGNFSGGLMVYLHLGPPPPPAH